MGGWLARMLDTGYPGMKRGAGRGRRSVSRRVEESLVDDT